MEVFMDRIQVRIQWAIVKAAVNYKVFYVMLRSLQTFKEAKTPPSNLGSLWCIVFSYLVAISSDNFDQMSSTT